MKEKLRIFENMNYSAVTKFVALIFLGASNIILARTLSSSDYGIVGFATVFINFLNLFNDFGIQNAVIQRQKLDDKGLYTAFTLKTLLGVFLFFVVWLLVPMVSYGFNVSIDKGIVLNVLRILALNFLVNIFLFLPNSILSRELNYRKISIAYLISAFVNSLISILLALAGFKYWSIVLANLSATVTLISVMNLFKPVKLKWSWDNKVTAEVMSYSFYLFVSGIVTFTIFNVDNLVVGAVTGSTMLGYYAIAFTWGAVVCNTLSSIMSPVLFPAYSKIQADRSQIRQSYLKSLEYVGFVSILAYVTLFIIAKEFLVQILGHGSEKWLPALVPLKIFCFYGIVRSLLEPVGNIIMAIGKTEIIYKATCLAAIVELVFLYPALRYFSIEGVALVVTLSYALQYFVYLPFLKNEFQIDPVEIFKAVKPALISLGVILAGYFIFEHVDYRSSMVLLSEEIIFTLLGYTVIYGMFTNWRILRDARNLSGFNK